MFTIKVCRFIPQARKIRQFVNMNRGFSAAAQRQKNLSRLVNGDRMYSADALKEKVKTKVEESAASTITKEDVTEVDEDLLGHSSLEGVNTTALGGGADEEMRSKDIEEEDSDAEFSDDGVDGEHAGTASKYYRFQ